MSRDAGHACALALLFLILVVNSSATMTAATPTYSIGFDVVGGSSTENDALLLEAAWRFSSLSNLADTFHAPDFSVLYDVF